MSLISNSVAGEKPKDAIKGNTGKHHKQHRGKLGSVPVITVDGPSGSGKGTIASSVAEKLGFHFLDSGALYRVCLLYTSPSPRDRTRSRMPSSA